MMFLPSHRSTRPTILVLWLLAVWLLQTVAGPGAAGATIYAPMTDAELADRSPLIAEVRVLAVEAAPGDRIATDYLVEVERLIKGALPAATLVVRVPGGVRPDGLGRHIWGAPKFREGDQALLFLEPRSDGTFALHQLLLGAFHLTGQDPGAPRIAWRDLSGARAITPAGDQAPIETSRDLGRFRRWLEDRERGRGRSADYFLAADPAGETVPAKFTTLLSSTDPPPLGCGGNGGHSLRWFDFDFRTKPRPVRRGRLWRLNGWADRGISPITGRAAHRCASCGTPQGLAAAQLGPRIASGSGIGTEYTLNRRR